MDAHLFRRFCEALIPTLLGARIEKIHQPGPGIVAFTVYGFPHGAFALPDTVNSAVSAADPHADRTENLSRKRFLVLKADRKSPLLFVAVHRMQVNAHPPATIMRLRKYLSDHRITSASLHWTERRLYLEVAADDAPVWLCLDLREGVCLSFTPPPPFSEPAWPETNLHELAENWRDWPVITPALRRTLPSLDRANAADREEGQALLMDLQAGGGDTFLYENEEGEREVSAWPLPKSQLTRMGQNWENYSETVWEDPLSALALAGERQVYVPLAADARKMASRPFSAEVKRLSRLLEKLESEEDRLQAMCAKQQDALLLQAQLYRFGPEEKQKTVELEPLEGEPRTLTLDPKLTVRGNMAALFHQAGRGKRGLEHLQSRRATVQAEKDAAVAAMVRSEAALMGTGAASAPSRQSHYGKSAGKNAGKNDAKGSPRTAPSLPKQVQAFRSSDGFLLLRGRDTKGNALALKMAAPHDFWLHTAHGPSAHVVIRRDHAAQEVPLSTLEEAGALAALKSWLRDEEKAEIQYSQARHIHAMKKAAPGMVRIDQSEGTFWTMLDQKLEERLRLGE